MNPRSAFPIKDNPPQKVLSLAESLTCLELHFVETDRMRDLSPLFKHAFLAARNLQAVHIGFPSLFPLDLNLEEIFHNIHWEKLRAFGIQSWRLDAEEIIGLARRHRETLRGLRLRDVQLKEGSMWKDVLAMLRTEMEQLDWVSLRRVGYSKYFDEQLADRMEIADDPWGAASDSDEEENSAQSNTGDEGDYTDSEGSEAHSQADTDHGPEANDVSISPYTQASLNNCSCSNSSFPASADDLGDNGWMVVYEQRKRWEKWVIGRCPEHGST